jgi:hypothetical protein
MCRIPRYFYSIGQRTHGTMRPTAAAPLREVLIKILCEIISLVDIAPKPGFGKIHIARVFKPNLWFTILYVFGLREK